MWMFFKGSSISHCQIKTPMHFTSIYFLIPAMWSSVRCSPTSHTIYNFGKLRYHCSEWILSSRCFRSINNLFYGLEGCHCWWIDTSLSGLAQLYEFIILWLYLAYFQYLFWLTVSFPLGCVTCPVMVTRPISEQIDATRHVHFLEYLLRVTPYFQNWQTR